jgi:hypothetical protein
MTVIQERFLEIRTRALLRRNRTERTTVPYKTAKQIGVIWTVEDKIKHDTIKGLIKKFEQDGKEVQVIEFLPKNKDNYEFRFDFFTEDNLSFWGDINSAGALKFANSAFDYLFYLDATPNPLILNLLARSKAKCRVGRSWEEGHPYFELMIDSASNINVMSETMYKYASQLR